MKIVQIITWDKAPMQNKFTFEAVDRTLQDLTQVDKPFGEKVDVMGDFWQVLPAIPRASRSQIVETPLNRSTIWNHVKVITLHQNMRVQQIMQDVNQISAQAQQDFSNWLQRIGKGTETVYPQYGANSIHIPPDMYIGCMPQDTISTMSQQTIYGHINDISNTED